jgi:hypothetical protein
MGDVGGEALPAVAPRRPGIRQISQLIDDDEVVLVQSLEFGAKRQGAVSLDEIIDQFMGIYKVAAEWNSLRRAEDRWQ